MTFWVGIAIAAASLAQQSAPQSVPQPASEAATQATAQTAPRTAPDAASQATPQTTSQTTPETASQTATCPVNVRIVLDRPVIPFHRQAKFSVIVEVPQDIEPRLPNMVDQFGGLMVANVDRRTETLKDQRRRITETYTLDPVFAKGYRIAPVTVAWGENQSVTVASPGLRVRDLTEDEKKAADEFADIAPPASEPNPLWPYRWILGGVGIAIVAGIALALLRRRARRVAARALPPPPPWDVAYARLRELDERQLPNKGEYEPFYVELSDILRRYIEDRFHLRAAEQTTQEFLTDAARADLFDAEHQRLLSGFLRHCDRVKFARYEPTVNEMEQSFAFVLQFVDETAEAPEPASPAESETQTPAPEKETAA